MKKVCRAVAGAMLWGAVAWGQEAPVPGDGAATVPPVILRDVRVQSIGAERWNEELPSGLLFLDAEDGDLCIADEDNPHGRVVCPCKNVDRHSFTNDLKINGHRILLNDAFSLQAEGSAVSLRHGTNAILQVLAEDYGNLAPLTAAFEDETHLLLTANAPADAVLQTTTNLLDEAGWQTATNAVIVETTDAATTWRITLLDGPVPEFYRVLASVSREAGIYANAALHAEAGVVIPEGQGVTMGTNTWNEWPDVGTIATNAANAAVADRATVDALAEVAGGVATNAGDIATNAAAIGAMEGRVATLERCDTCTLFWATSNGGLSSSEQSYLLPINFPTPKLKVYVFTYYTTNITIGLPAWNPGRDVEIDLILPRSPHDTNNTVSLMLAGNLMYAHAGYAGTRLNLHFSKDVGRWFSSSWNMTSGQYATGNTSPDGSDYTTNGSRLSNAPATVAQWVTKHPEWADAYEEMQAATPTLSLSPSLSPTISPSLSPSLSPLVFEEDELENTGIEEEEQELETE